MNKIIRKNIFFFLFILVIFAALISCKEEQPTESESNGTPNLTLQGQTLTGMIVHLNNGTTEYYVNNETLLARGGAPLSAYTWSVANLSAMPAGTIVEPLTGIFKSNGGILVAGSHQFKMTVSDGSHTTTGNFTFNVQEYQDFGPLAVFQQPLGVFNINLPDANSGYGYGASLWALGNGSLPWSWYLESGELPPGLVIDQANGIVRGTPNSSAAGTTYNFTVRVKDKDNNTALSDVLTYHIKVSK